MVNEMVVKVFNTQVSVTGGSLDLEDTLLNGQEGNIRGSSIRDRDGSDCH